MALSAPAQGNEQPPTAIDLHELFYGAHLPRDRTASRSLQLAQELLDQERYSEAIPLLLGVLNRGDDAFDLLMRADHAAPTSLRTRAADSLQSLSSAGQRAYRLEVEARSRRAIQQAAKGGDVASLLRIVRSVPGTDSAAMAHWLVAMAASDAGDTDYAIAALDRVALFDKRQSFEPQRALLQASLLTARGENEQSLEVIQWLSARGFGAAEVAPGVPIRDASGVAEWLRRQLNRSRPLATPDDARWHMAYGGRQRNPQRSAGPPHPWARWTAMTLANPAMEDELTQYAYFLESHKRPVPTVAQPIAQEDLVFMRTPETIVAVDFDSGRRVWETRRPILPSPSVSQQTRSSGRSEGADEEPLTRQSLRTWFDPVSNSLSCDERHVYAVEPIAGPQRQTERWSPFALQRGQWEQLLGASRNRLVAYSIPTEGKLAWTLGGVDKGPLSQAFFLSAPMAVGDDLVALVEIEQSVCLVLLAPETGELRWKQPLVSVERGVAQNSMRRFVGGATACSGAQVICSTGAGVVVCVDLLSRSLVWVDRFPADKGQRTTDTRPWRRRPRDVWPQMVEKTWLENRVLITGDRVLVASPESPLLHCLDRLTGQVLWRTKRASGALLLGADQGVALVGEAQAIRAIQLEDGTTKWRTALSRDAVLAGRAVIFADKLLCPLSDGSLVLIATAEGTPAGQVVCWSGGGAGNLIVHRQSLLSQTFASLDRYDQGDLLLATAREQLQVDPSSVDALCVLGEALLSEGAVDAAVDRFTAAYEEQPTSALARDRLRRALVTRLRQTGPNAADLALLEPLVTSSHQRLELRVQALELAIRQRELVRAVTLAEDLIHDPPLFDVMISTDAGHLVSPIRRVSALLAQAWQAADAAQRSAIGSNLRSVAEGLTSAEELTRFASIFSGLPEVADVESRRRQRLHEEQLWLPLAMAEATAPAGDFVSQSYGSYRKSPTDSHWATKQIVAKVFPDAQANAPNRFRNSRGRTLGLRPVVLRHTFSSEPEPSTGTPIDRFLLSLESASLLGLDDHGRTVYRTDLSGAAGAYLRQGRSSAQVEAWRLGPCLYIAAGENLVAIETLRSHSSDDRRLWSTEALSQTLSRRDRGFADGVANRGHRAVQFDPAAPVEIVAATAQGIVFRKGDALLAVDPLDGSLLWLRPAAQLSEMVLADQQHLYVVAEGGAGKRLSLVDGSDAGDWRPFSGRLLCSEGGNVATFVRGPKESVLKVADLSTGEELLQRNFRSPTQVKVVDGALVLLSATGMLELIDTASGQLLLETELRLPRTPRVFLPQIRRGRLVVTLGYGAAATKRSRGATALDAGQPSVEAMPYEVFCLDIQSGQRAWPRPVSFHGRAPLSRIPEACPLLFFGAKKDTRVNGRSASSTNLLVVDETSGRTIYRANNLSTDATDQYRISYLAGRSPQVRISVPGSEIRLSPSEFPAPPSPPSSDAIETGAGSRSVSGIVQQFQQVFRFSIRPKAEQNAPPAEDEE